MKGKYATRAESTRARIEAQGQAESNEHRIRALEKQIAQMRTEHDKVVKGLRADLTIVVRDRDAQTSPALSDTQRRIRILEAERDTAREQAAAIQKGWDAAGAAMLDWFTGMGMTMHEAEEKLMGMLGKPRVMRVDGDQDKRFAQSHGNEALLRLQVIRGQRGASEVQGDVAVDNLDLPERAAELAAQVHPDLLVACVRSKATG